MLKRWICLLLTLALCCAPLFTALSEDIEISGGEGEAFGTDAMPEELGAGDSLLSFSDGEQYAPDAPAEPEQETSQVQVVPLEFVPGYRRVAVDEALFYRDAASTEAAAKLFKGGILYAAFEVEGRVGVAFNSERGIVTGFVDERALAEMTDGEVAAFQSEIATAPTQALFEDDINRPLATPECVFFDGGEAPAEAAEPTQPEAEQSPESPEQPLDAEGQAAEGESTEAEPYETEPSEESGEDGAEALVSNAGPTLTLSATEITIGIKQTFSLAPVVLEADGSKVHGIKYSYATSNKKGASVSSKGVVKGVKKGTYIITVTASNGMSATCAVKVVKAPSKVTISPKNLTVGLGETVKLKVSFPKGTMASCKYSSSKKSIITIDKEGNMTGLREGSSVIKVTTHNGKTAKATVTVTRGPQFISLNGEYTLEYDELTESYRVVYTRTLEAGRTFQITYENEYATSGAIAGYTSENPDVAVVSETGLVTALEPGVANIVVRSTSGAEAILRVTVPGTPRERIAFNAASIGLRAGSTVAAPTLRGSNIAASTLAAAQYASDNPGVFTVEWSATQGQWLLTGVNPGAATLTATAGSATASVGVTVSDATSAAQIHFERELVYMYPGESYAPVVLDENNAAVSAALSTSDPTVASVSDQGTIIAAAEGTATITASYGALAATMNVVVRSAGATITLDDERLTLGIGQRQTLKAVVNGDGSAATLTFQSSDESVVTVTNSGVLVGRAAGQALVTVSEARGAMATCTVSVCAAPTALSVQPGVISERLKTGGKQLTWSFGSTDETGSVSFSSADPSIASVNGDGYVSFVSAGMTTITVVTSNGLSAEVSVTVLPNKQETQTTDYRLFCAYSYHDALPFTKNNATSMADVFGKSSIGGLTYSTKVLGNPSKTQIFSGISGFFSNADDNDVSIVYLCSHGHNNSASYTGYRMSLPGYDDNKNNPNYFMTASEIFNCVARIRGSVVLILDSCYSGTFLQDMGGRLDAEGGRIAVLTAASNTRATYYNVKKNSVDFFTFFLLQGLGYNEREGWWNSNAKGSKGKYPGYLSADKTGNNDGIVTLGEFYDFAAKCIAANIPSYMKKSWYWGDKKKVQQTRFYAGNLQNLVIYQPR